MENDVCVGNYSVSMSNAFRFVKDQGIFATEKFDALHESEEEELARCAICFVLQWADGIDNICAKIDERNEATASQLPAVLGIIETRQYLLC
jgi:hypothetical protein